MSCGQSELAERNKHSLGLEVVPIYSPPFWRMQNEALQLVGRFLMTDADPVLVFGTGTGGIEAALNSILEPRDRFLVAHNGLFGEIMSTLVRRVGAESVEVRFELGTPVDPDVVARALRDHQGIKGIGLVQSETSTGVRNPVRELGALAREHNALFVVDAVSSFASEELLVDEWGVDLCVVNGQKCLGAPQGLSVVTVSPAAWQAMRSRRTQIPGFYMNLLACWDYLRMATTEEQNWQAGRIVNRLQLEEAPHPASPSFVLLKGLWASLRDLQEEGLDACILRHQTAGLAVRTAVESLGLERMCKDARFADNAVTAVFLPDTIDDYTLRRYLFERYGVILGDANMVSWDDYRRQIGRNYVRIGTMAGAACFHKVQYAVFALGMSLMGLGAPVTASAIGEAVKRVQEVYAGRSML